MPRRFGYHINRLTMLAWLLLLAGRIQAKEAIEGAPGKLKEWSFSYEYIHLKTISGSLYDIQSVGLNYYTRNRWRFPLITSTTLFTPVAINHDGTFFPKLLRYYESKIGVDFMMGIEFGRSIGNLWRWRVSPGWNIIAISMRGLPGYYPFQSLTSGPAVNLIFDRNWEQGMKIRMGLSASYQIFDLIHSADKLDSGYSIQLTIGIGFRDGSAFGRIDYE